MTSAMPNAHFKTRTTFTDTSRQPVKAREGRKSGTVDFAGIHGAESAAMPATLAPPLATLVKAPPAGAGWVHEVKYDGYRCASMQGVDRGLRAWLQRPQSCPWSARVDGEICVEQEARTFTAAANRPTQR
jgi:hypothetical protein